MPIHNCNPASRCEVFDYVPFDRALLDCKGPVEDEPLDCLAWYDKRLTERHFATHPEPLDERRIAALRGFDPMAASPRAVA